MNKFTPQQDSIAKIKACEDEAAELAAKSQNEEISRKQKQLHVLVSMIQEFRIEEKNDKRALSLNEIIEADSAACDADVAMAEDK